MEQLTLAFINNMKNLETTIKEEKIHLRLMGETFSVTEHLDNIPIQKKRDQLNPSYKLNNPSSKIWNFGSELITNNHIIKNLYLNTHTKETLNKEVDSNDFFSFDSHPHNGEIWVGNESRNVTNDEFREHYGKLTSTVECYRRTLIFSETEKHYKLTSYYINKIRICGFKYYKTKRRINSIILNKHTGDTYLRTAEFKNRKWSIKLMKNPIFKFLNSLNDFVFMSNKFGNNTSDPNACINNDNIIDQRTNDFESIYLTNEGLCKIINVLGVDLSKFNYLPFDTLSKSVPDVNQSLSMTLILWFLNKKGIKYPNNPFPLLNDCYPKIKLLRKNNMNLTQAVLNSFGMKSKALIKLINQNPEISCFNIFIWYHILGHDYFVQLNPLLFKSKRYDYLDNKRMIGEVLLRFGITIESTVEIINNPSLWENLGQLLTKKEKYQIFKIVRSINLDEDNMITLLEITDHFKFKKALLEYNDVVKIKSNNKSEFLSEHNLWADKLHNYQKAKVIKYTYLKIFLEHIETPQFVEFYSGEIEKYYPIVLKTDSEYEEESSIQNHCVKTYVHTYNSLIISIRKNDKFSYDRITCEYRYYKDSNTFRLIQMKGESNSEPKENYKPVLDNISKILSDFCGKYQYIRPKVTEINKHSNIEKILFEEDLAVKKELAYNEFDFFG